MRRTNSGAVTASWLHPYFVSEEQEKSAPTFFHHVWYSLNTWCEEGELPWLWPLSAPGQGGRDGWVCSPPCSLYCPWAGMGPFIVTDPSFKLVGKQQKKSTPKRVFLSPGQFQQFEMWLGVNLTGKSKVSVDDFGFVTSKDMSKYRIQHEHGIKTNLKLWQYVDIT